MGRMASPDQTDLFGEDPSAADAVAGAQARKPANQPLAARMRPLEATYLAWLDLRAYGVADPAAAGVEHGVRLAPGADYHPGLEGHVRLNLATSAERLERIVHRMATALTPRPSSLEG